MCALARGLARTFALVSALALQSLPLQAQPLQLTEAYCLVSQASTPPEESAAWQPCPLPDRWSANGRQAAGSVWYRLTLPEGAAGSAASASAQERMLWLPLLSMNAEAWLDGRRLASTTDAAGGRTTRHWNHPWLVGLPAAAGPTAFVHLRIQASPINEGLLAAPWLGTVPELRARQAKTLFWRVSLPGWGVAYGLALGLIFLLIRFQDAQQRTWGYFGAGAVLWSIANLNLTAVHVPMPDAAWEAAVHVIQFLGLLCLVLFGLSHARALTPALRVAGVAYGGVVAVLMPVVVLRGTGQWMMVLMLPLLLAGAYALATIVRSQRLAKANALRHTHRRDALGQLALALAATLVMLSAGHDWASRVGWLSLERPFMLPLAAPVLLSALAWMLAGDYVRLRTDLSRTHAELDDRLRAREQELAQIHAAQARAQSELAVVQERARILRDMHDGAGAHLSAAIRMAEAGADSRGALAQTLREALDQLKLSIDSLHLPAGDVVALLATVRYRLEPRLVQAGIALQWYIGEVPPWPGGRHDRAMQHLMFIVFEIISNVLQHARATRLSVRATGHAQAIELEFSDNGCGVARGAEPPLKTLRARAQLIGARLELSDTNPGLRVCVVLRLDTESICAAAAGPHRN